MSEKDKDKDKGKKSMMGNGNGNGNINTLAPPDGHKFTPSPSPSHRTETQTHSSSSSSSSTSTSNSSSSHSSFLTRLSSIHLFTKRSPSPSPSHYPSSLNKIPLSSISTNHQKSSSSSSSIFSSTSTSSLLSPSSSSPSPPSLHSVFFSPTKHFLFFKLFLFSSELQKIQKLKSENEWETNLQNSNSNVNPNPNPNPMPLALSCGFTFLCPKLIGNHCQDIAMLRAPCHISQIIHFPFDVGSIDNKKDTENDPSLSLFSSCFSFVFLLDFIYFYHFDFMRKCHYPSGCKNDIFQHKFIFHFEGIRIICNTVKIQQKEKEQGKERGRDRGKIGIESNPPSISTNIKYEEDKAKVKGKSIIIASPLTLPIPSSSSSFSSLSLSSSPSPSPVLLVPNVSDSLNKSFALENKIKIFQVNRPSQMSAKSDSECESGVSDNENDNSAPIDHVISDGNANVNDGNESQIPFEKDFSPPSSVTPIPLSENQNQNPQDVSSPSPSITPTPIMFWVECEKCERRISEKMILNSKNSKEIFTANLFSMMANLHQKINGKIFQKVFGTPMIVECSHQYQCQNHEGKCNSIDGKAKGKGNEDILQFLHFFRVVFFSFEWNILSIWKREIPINFTLDSGGRRRVQGQDKESEKKEEEGGVEGEADKVQDKVSHSHLKEIQRISTSHHTPYSDSQAHSHSPSLDPQSNVIDDSHSLPWEWQVSIPSSSSSSPSFLFSDFLLFLQLSLSFWTICHGFQNKIYDHCDGNLQEFSLLSLEIHKEFSAFCDQWNSIPINQKGQTVGFLMSFPSFPFVSPLLSPPSTPPPFPPFTPPHLGILLQFLLENFFLVEFCPFDQFDLKGMQQNITRKFHFWNRKIIQIHKGSGLSNGEGNTKMPPSSSSAPFVPSDSHPFWAFWRPKKSKKKKEKNSPKSKGKINILINDNETQNASGNTKTKGNREKDQHEDNDSDKGEGEISESSLSRDISSSLSSSTSSSPSYSPPSPPSPLSPSSSSSLSLSLSSSFAFKKMDKGQSEKKNPQKPIESVAVHSSPTSPSPSLSPLPLPNDNDVDHNVPPVKLNISFPSPSPSLCPPFVTMDFLNEMCPTLPPPLSDLLFASHWDSAFVHSNIPLGIHNIPMEIKENEPNSLIFHALSAWDFRKFIDDSVVGAASLQISSPTLTFTETKVEIIGNEGEGNFEFHHLNELWKGGRGRGKNVEAVGTTREHKGRDLWDIDKDKHKDNGSHIQAASSSFPPLPLPLPLYRRSLYNMESSYRPSVQRKLLNHWDSLNSPSQLWTTRVEEKENEFESSFSSAMFCCSFKVKVYFPLQFFALRSHSHVCDGDYDFIRSLLATNPWDAKGGKSGSKFSLTGDGRYVLKFVGNKEFSMFLSNAQKYFQHMDHHLFDGNPSLLNQIIGAFHIQIKRKPKKNNNPLSIPQMSEMSGNAENNNGNSVFNLKTKVIKCYVLVMKNINFVEQRMGMGNPNSQSPLSDPQQVVENREISTSPSSPHCKIFDLKGSERNRYVDIKEKEKEKDNGNEKNKKNKGEKEKEKKKRKDNDNCNGNGKDNDTQQQKEESENENDNSQNSENDSAPISLSSLSPLCVLLDSNFLSLFPSLPCPLNIDGWEFLVSAMDFDLDFLCHSSVVDYSLLAIFHWDTKQIQFGIIDYIRQYTWDKKIESGVKSVGKLAGGKTPTIISPVEYKQRFKDKITKYFIPNATWGNTKTKTKKWEGVW